MCLIGLIREMFTKKMLSALNKGALQLVPEQGLNRSILLRLKFQIEYSLQKICKFRLFFGWKPPLKEQLEHQGGH